MVHIYPIARAFCSKWSKADGPIILKISNRQTLQAELINFADLLIILCSLALALDNAKMMPKRIFCRLWQNVF
jgi:hypothetical protein